VRGAALLLVGCCACSLGGKQPRYDYYVLTPGNAPARPAARPAAGAPPATVGVSQVTIPGYLDREQIVTRAEDHRLIYSPRDRWAEPLDRAFERTLRQDLAAALAADGITVPPAAGAPTYDVQVDVLRFERRGTGQIELWARWTLRTDAGLVHAGETRLQVAVADAGNAAAAASLSRAIARLAQDIAARVRVAAAEPAREAPVRSTRRE